VKAPSGTAITSRAPSGESATVAHYKGLPLKDARIRVAREYTKWTWLRSQQGKTAKARRASAGSATEVDGGIWIAQELAGATPQKADLRDGQCIFADHGKLKVHYWDLATRSAGPSDADMTINAGPRSGRNFRSAKAKAQNWAAMCVAVSK
jgi:hypothetical protein